MDRDLIFIILFVYIPIILILYVCISRYLKHRKETFEELIIRERKARIKWLKLQSILYMSMSIFIRICGTLLIVYGVGVYIYQLYFWLKHGFWLELPFWKLVEHIKPNIIDIINLSWKGIEKIIFWIFDVSGALITIICGFIVIAISYGFASLDANLKLDIASEELELDQKINELKEETND
jgi:hypothetical protein